MVSESDEQKEEMYAKDNEHTPWSVPQTDELLKSFVEMWISLCSHCFYGDEQIEPR